MPAELGLVSNAEGESVGGIEEGGAAAEEEVLGEMAEKAGATCFFVLSEHWPNLF